MAGGAGTHIANRHQQARKDSLRELLSQQGHLQHVVELLDESRQLSFEPYEDERNKVTRLKLDQNMAVIDRKLKLLNKYVPDLKQVEAHVEATGSVELIWGKPHKIIDVEPSTT